MPTAAGLYYFFHAGANLTKPPLILIHGAGGDHLFWPAEIRRLVDHRVYALDLPGHGKSGGAGLQSVSDYARSVVEFMQALGLSKAVIAGHSLGGAIALILALEHARRVTGIVLVGTGARLPVASTILDNAANPATFPLVLQAILDWGFSPQADQRLKELAGERLAKTRPTLLYGDFLACDKFDVSKRLGKIRVPTLVICGTEDKLTPIRYSEALAAEIPAAALQTVDGAGHMVMLEQPHRVAGALALFMKTIPYKPRV